MAKRKAVERDEYVVPGEQYRALGVAMAEYAERSVMLEPVMLRLSRLGGFKATEKHIVKLRKIVARRKAG